MRRVVTNQVDLLRPLMANTDHPIPGDGVIVTWERSDGRVTFVYPDVSGAGSVTQAISHIIEAMQEDEKLAPLLGEAYIRIGNSPGNKLMATMPDSAFMSVFSEEMQTGAFVDSAEQPPPRGPTSATR